MLGLLLMISTLCIAWFFVWEMCGLVHHFVVFVMHVVHVFIVYVRAGCQHVVEVVLYLF